MLLLKAPLILLTNQTSPTFIDPFMKWISQKHFVSFMNLTTIILTIVFFIASLLIGCATVAVMNAIAKNKVLPLGSAVRIGAKKTIPVVSIIILNLLSLGLVYALSVGIGFLITFLLVCLSIIKDFPIGIIFFVSIIPVVYLMARFSFATLFIIIDNAGIIESLRKSYRLIANHWWNTSLRLLSLYIIFLLPNIFIGFFSPKMFHILNAPFALLITGIFNATSALFITAGFIEVFYNLQAKQNAKTPLAIKV